MIKPEAIRINTCMISVSITETDNFHIEAEYLYKKLWSQLFDDVHAVNSFVNYDSPLQ